MSEDSPTITSAELMALIQGNANQLANLTEAVANLTAASASSATGASSGSSPTSSSAPSFALAPGLAQPGALLDYTTKYGSNQWTQGTASLSTHVDLKTGVTEVFRSELNQRSNNQGWQALFKFQDSEGATIHLIDHYGRIDLDQVKAQTADLVGVGSNVKTRKAQDNAQACQCLFNSLTVSAKALVLTHRDDYIVTTANADGDQETFTVAARMLKVIMNIITVDSRATERQLRANMRNLPAVMRQCNYDIELFQKYVKENLSQLDSRGAKVEDEIQLLFEGYKAAGDVTFVKHMQTLQESHDNNWNGLGAMTAQKLNAMALDKYKILKKVWRKQVVGSAEQQIVAMNAEIGRLRDESSRLKGQLKLKSKTNPNNKKQGKTKNKKSNTNKSKQKQEEIARKTPPKDGEPLTKTVKGKVLNWCPHHMAWVAHLPEDCKLGKQRMAEQLQAQSATTSEGANVASSSTTQALDYLAAVATSAARDE